MSSYTRLFADIIHSTVWREEMHVKVVWITMLAMANREGEVMASLPGLADAARVSFHECLDAVERLKAPDTWSRTKDHEGRRIVEIEGGWLILNYADKRDLQLAEERRAQVREAVARHRAARRAAKAEEAVAVITNDESKHGNPGNPVEGAVMKVSPPEPDPEPDPETTPQRQKHPPKPPAVRLQAEPWCAADFWDVWQQEGAAHGAPQPNTASPKEYEQHLRRLMESYTEAQLRAALAAWWASPFTGGRNLGMFACQVGEVLEHLSKSPGAVFRAPAAKSVGPTFSPEAWAADRAAKRAMR